jgi:acetyltransferase-like isoleucine patch superfamily enzyme
MKAEIRAEHGDVFSCDDGCLIGVLYRAEAKPTIFGSNCRIRWGTVIYGDVITGDDFQTGHHVMIREKTKIGSHVVVGTGTVIDGQVEIGDFVKIESQCYIPTHVRIGNRVFLGPGVTLTNDRYPLKQRASYRPEGPIIEDGATLGGRVTVCPGVRIGEDAFVAAGAVVTKDVPSRSLAVGVPARIKPLPPHLIERNLALSWRRFLSEGKS